MVFGAATAASAAIVRNGDLETGQTRSLPSNQFAKGKLTLDKTKGTGVLAVSLPNAGSLTASDARRQLAVASCSDAPRQLPVGADRRESEPKPILIRTATLHASAGGTVKVPIKPTASGRKLLEEEGKVAFKIELTFTPTGGTARVQGYTGKLVKTLRPARR